MLFVRTEFADFVDNGSEQLIGRDGVWAAQSFDEALLAKLFAVVVKGFGNAVGVEGESIAG